MTPMFACLLRMRSVRAETAMVKRYQSPIFRRENLNDLITMVGSRPGADYVERIDVAVIGAGVSGLAAARAIALRGLSTCVLERHPRPGLDTSTHNSGVIHAGLYYPHGSLKARLSVEGRPLLYEFCRRNGVPYRQCGKLIAAVEDPQIPRLEALLARGIAN